MSDEVTLRSRVIDHRLTTVPEAPPVRVGANDYQATVHPIGAELPFSLGDGWEFDGSRIEVNDLGEAVFLLAKWRRRRFATVEEIAAQRESWAHGEMAINAAERAEGRHTVVVRRCDPCLSA